MAELTDEEYGKIRKTIFRKMYSKNAWGASHILFERLQSGTPSHMCGYVKGVLKDLVSKGFVVYYGPTKYGDAYHLNIKKKVEIEKVIFG